MKPHEQVCIPGRVAFAVIEEVREDRGVALIRYKAVNNGAPVHEVVRLDRLRPVVIRYGYEDDDGHWRHWRWVGGGVVLPPPSGPMEIERDILGAGEDGDPSETE